MMCCRIFLPFEINFKSFSEEISTNSTALFFCLSQYNSIFVITELEFEDIFEFDLDFNLALCAARRREWTKLGVIFFSENFSEK